MGINYSDIIEKMRWAGKLKNDSAVARVLGVTPQALSNYKKRGEMPTDLVLKFAKLFGLSVDWLIHGVGEMYRPGAEASEKGMKDYVFAAEGATTYGQPKKLELAVLSPVEIIYIGKLLKVLRGENKSNAAAIKHTVDAFMESSDLPSAGGGE
jgi:hypothetical protein